jgi:Sigma-70 factor, region 1.1
MASNIKALPEKNMRGAPENRDMPLPLLDLSDAAVKELIRSAKKRGYVTLDEINSVLPSKEANSEQIKKSCRFSEKWASSGSGHRIIETCIQSAQ